MDTSSIYAPSEPEKPVLSVVVKGKPVSVNRAYGKRAGGVYQAADAAAWREAVLTEIRGWRAERGYGFTKPLPVRLPLRVKLTFFGVAGDVDNYCKITLDGLKYGLCIDDRHFAVVEAHIHRKTERADGKATPERVQGVGIDVFEAPVPPDAPDEMELPDVPIAEVTIFPALAYDCLVLMFPAETSPGRQEWGAFVSIGQARELHAKLGVALAQLESGDAA